MSDQERECPKCFRKGIDTMRCTILDCPYNLMSCDEPNIYQTVGTLEAIYERRITQPTKRFNVELQIKTAN